MDTLLKICWIGLGGFLGANARYWLGGWIGQRFGTQFPWGTLVINVTGSFLLGVVVVLISDRFIVSPHWRLLVAIGFLGAYTTFSTFEYETFKLAENGSILWALANVLLSVVAGFLALWLGDKLARVF